MAIVVTSDMDGAIPPHVDGAIMLIRATTAAATVPMGGTGAGATTEDAGGGNDLLGRDEIPTLLALNLWCV